MGQSARLGACDVDAVVLGEAQSARLQTLRFGRALQLAETTSTNAVALEEAQRAAPRGPRSGG